MNCKTVQNIAYYYYYVPYYSIYCNKISSYIANFNSVKIYLQISILTQSATHYVMKIGDVPTAIFSIKIFFQHGLCPHPLRELSMLPYPLVNWEGGYFCPIPTILTTTVSWISASRSPPTFGL